MIKQYLKQIETELKNREPDRHQEQIGDLARWIVKQHQSGERVYLNFICTHNSRRSQFAQSWSILVQHYFGQDLFAAGSGGTEVTACNPRTVAALERAGCTIQKKGAQNPVYSISSDLNDATIELWSKLFDDESHPSGSFAAVMTCDHADANCPFIPGASIRIPITYTDPKFADDTDEEKAAYDETCRMIATDMVRLSLAISRLQTD